MIECLCEILKTGVSQLETTLYLKQLSESSLEVLNNEYTHCNQYMCYTPEEPRIPRVEYSDYLVPFFMFLIVNLRIFHKH